MQSLPVSALSLGKRAMRVKILSSADHRREQIVVGNGKASVRIGSLPAGSYAFPGDFHAETAQGRLIAK